MGVVGLLEAIPDAISPFVGDLPLVEVCLFVWAYWDYWGRGDVATFFLK